MLFHLQKVDVTIDTSIEVLKISTAGLISDKKTLVPFQASKWVRSEPFISLLCLSGFQAHTKVTAAHEDIFFFTLFFMTFFF